MHLGSSPRAEGRAQFAGPRQIRRTLFRAGIALGRSAGLSLVAAQQLRMILMHCKVPNMGGHDATPRNPEIEGARESAVQR
jgi:hypothetical protein